MDVYYDCAGASGPLCQEADRAAFHDAYEDCRPEMTNETCFLHAHARNQARTWRGTRDVGFDDGSAYTMVLAPGATRDCLHQRLDLMTSEPVSTGYAAAWTCGEGAKLFFWSAPFNCTNIAQESQTGMPPN